MSDLESKKLEDDALEDVTGGGFFSSLVFRGVIGRKNMKLVTLEQKGEDNDWTLSTLEQKTHGRKRFSKGSGGMSKL